MQTSRVTRQDTELVTEAFETHVDAAKDGEEIEATVELGRAELAVETRDAPGFDHRYFDVTVGYASGRPVHHEVLGSDVQRLKRVIESTESSLDLLYHEKLEKLHDALRVP